MIRSIKKKAKSIVCSVLAAVTLFTMNPAVFATETATQTDTVSSVDVSGSDAADKSNTDSTADSTTPAGSEANDKVTIGKNDKPYLSLGADLTPDQRATVLGFMGIELTDLDKYDVVYVNNDEEHKYLDSYISKSEIGTRSLSSVLITEDKKGAGLSVSTHNINYCTVGMYKNALATAGIADAKIIVAGPFPISGTAALVGTLKAYEEMTGKKLDDKVTDAAMDELVTTGELNKSIDGDSQDIEAMIADLKKQLADGRLKDESQIKDAIKEAAKDYAENLLNEADEDDENDDVPVSDYGYVSKNGDIWIYTGVTSVNGDRSNIGFLLANERTGEAHYYSIAGADEKSAMAAAEGEVQEKGYQASFPSLINVEGHPTYIMVLKDASGLVKLYAAVNVEQYNIVTTASSQTECLNRYKQLLGIESGSADNNNNQPDNSTSTDNDAPNSVTGSSDISEPTVADAETNLTITDIKYIDINGNTYIYLISENDTLYRAKAASHEDMLLLKKGDNVHIAYSGKDIVTCEKQN